MQSRRTCVVGIALAASLALAPVNALAQTSAEVREEVASVQGEIDTLSGRIAEGEERVRELQEQVDSLADESIALQAQIIDDRDTLAEIISTNYKDNADARVLALLLSSKTMDELVSQVYYAQKVSDWQAECIQRLKDDKAELDGRVAEINQAKDQQKAALADLSSQREALAEKVASLNEKAEALEAQEAEAARQAAAAAAAAAASQQAAREQEMQTRQESIEQAQESGDVSTTGTDTSGSGWISCVASAYTIADNDPPGSTATSSGIPLNDSVCTVAMPMSMNPSAYYGARIEISYGGTSVIATVTDCGAMGGGSRGLDLSTATFRALGAGSADEWGLRTVSYRFL